MKYNYFARNQEGNVQIGVVEANNEALAVQTLQDHNLIIIRLEAAERASLFIKDIRIFKGVKRKQIFVFFRQLSVLIEASVPLVQSLISLAQQEENKRFAEIIFEVANDVEGGMLFSKALTQHPKIFSAFAVHLIQSGEAAGRLQETLTYLADYLEKEYYLLSKVRGAMIYPAFIFGVFIIVGVLIMVMVIPNLSAILLEAGQDLPWPTKVVIATSNFLIKWGWLVLLAVIGLAAAAVFYLRTNQGSDRWDALKLKLPLFGKIYQKTYLARLADTLNALVKSGVAIINSLTITSQVVGNAVFRDILLETRDNVRVGKKISVALESYKEFPALFTQMVKTGESTGKLNLILEKISIFYNKEVENVVNNLIQLMEPMMIIILAIGVAILVFAVYMPIYNLAGAM